MKKLLFLTLLFGLMFSSCQKEKVKESIETNDTNVITKDEGRAIFAKTLAKSMATNPELKDFLIKEAQKKIYGDYEISYAMKRNELIGGKTFATILYENYKKENSISIRTNDELLLNYFEEDILINDPYLTIYIPSILFDNLELLDLDTKVGYFSEDTFNEEIDEYVQMVDQNGLITNLSVDSYPENTSVFIVKQSENTLLIRTDDNKTTINGNNIDDILGLGVIIENPGADPCQYWLDYIDALDNTEIQNGSYVQTAVAEYYGAYLECSGAVGSAGGIPCDEECERDCWSDKDEILNVKFVDYDNLKSVESWIKGDVELKAIVMWGENFSSPSTAIPRKIEKFGTFEREAFFESCNIFNGGCTGPKYLDNALAWETFTWDIHDGDSDEVQIMWVEIDELDLQVTTTLTRNIKFSVAGITASVGLSFGVKFDPNKDKGCGESIVEWCDDAIPPGFEYTPGRVKFLYDRINFQ